MLLAIAVAPCGCFGDSDSQHGRTALIWAAINDHADCVRLLIDAGADKDINDAEVRFGCCFAEAPSRVVTLFFLFLIFVAHN
jgi:ankyrin repeat protein